MSSKNKSEESVKDTKRFPDFGSVHIDIWDDFLVSAKEKFNERWNKPFNHPETLEDFTQLSFLGIGYFGGVILIKHKENGKYYAMKAIDKDKIIKFKQLEHTKNEKLILQSIDFPFTVYLMFFFKDNSYIYMVMPFIPGGELFSHLRKVGKFDELQAKFYVSQVVLALEYLHYLDLVYRYLKPENIMLDQTGYIKVTDFGFCKRLTQNRTYTVCGTPEYLAPEVILSKGYGKAVDWWAVGVLMYELVAGNPPFYANEVMKIYQQIVSLNFNMPISFSSELKDLIKNMLQVDLTRRFGNMKHGVEDIKDHKWFRPINWMAILNRKMTAPYQPKYKSPGDTEHFEQTKFEPLKIAKENRHPQEFADF